MDNWKKLKPERVSSIKKMVAEFEIWEMGIFPDTKFVVKIWECANGTYEGTTDLRVRNSSNQYCPGFGLGKTVEEALEHTISDLNEQIDALGEYCDEDFSFSEQYNLQNRFSPSSSVNCNPELKHFIDAETRKKYGGTLYFEFQQGSDKEECWADDSLYLYAVFFDEMELYHVFVEGLGFFNYWGITEITKEQWNDLFNCGISKNGEIAELFKELRPWAEDCFSQHKKMVIKGI